MLSHLLVKELNTKGVFVLNFTTHRFSFSISKDLLLATRRYNSGVNLPPVVIWEWADYSVAEVGSR